MSASNAIAGRIESGRTDNLERLEGEVWLCRRLLRHGVDALAGITESELDRKARFRAAIQTHGLDAVVAGSDHGKTVTYEQAFRRLYHEKL